METHPYTTLDESAAQVCQGQEKVSFVSKHTTLNSLSSDVLTSYFDEIMHIS